MSRILDACSGDRSLDALQLARAAGSDLHVRELHRAMEHWLLSHPAFPRQRPDARVELLHVMFRADGSFESMVPSYLQYFGSTTTTQLRNGPGTSSGHS